MFPLMWGPLPLMYTGVIVGSCERVTEQLPNRTPRAGNPGDNEG